MPRTPSKRTSDMTNDLSSEDKVTPSKLAKARPSRLGAVCSYTYSWLPRPAAWPSSGQYTLPRTAVGVNEYFHLLSMLHPSAVRGGGGRGRHTRWEVTPENAGLVVHQIKMRQHYETPAAVVETVRRRWSPDFDAMASPINAICSDYATLEDNLFSLSLYERCIFTNPAYAPEEASRGSEGIDLALAKLINDVRSHGCTLIALLPNLTHTTWYERYVDIANEVHLISGNLVFPNPFVDMKRSERSFLWSVRSYIIAIWRPGPPPSTPVAPARLHLDEVYGDHPSRKLRLRVCQRCGKLRMLPRYQMISDGDRFECSLSEDSKYGGECSKPMWVPQAIAV
mmetsp:Transcript_46025/g.120587  ORF Transcript_46025/g.120587 Transcript_46025/m.120587 type:complete len:339 (-) Transcript_46025:40-1056(-)